MSVLENVRSQRLCLGLTQVELAAQAQIALPTLQQLEAGTSNPSIDTLEKLGRVLGFSVELQLKTCDWDRLIELGLPLMRAQSSALGPRHRGNQGNKEDLVRELRTAIIEASAGGCEARKTEAVAALILALSTHYPSFFRAHFGRNQQAEFMARVRSGRVVKLRRLALAKISEYL
ncbi:helix-turn-helix domain-containing protein [Bdellovibrionota bacterium FG-2]